MAISNNSSPISSTKKKSSYNKTMGSETFREQMKLQFQKKIEDAIGRKELNLANKYESNSESRKQYANN